MVSLVLRIGFSSVDQEVWTWLEAEKSIETFAGKVVFEKNIMDIWLLAFARALD
jgi:hypothetical protein